MSDPTLPARLAILGPGLLGGSIALAVEERMPECRVSMWARREDALGEIRERELGCFVSTDPGEVIAGADLVVLGVPIGAMPSLAERIAPLLARGALVTDVGSVKGQTVAELSAILGDHYVGSHPMAGSDRSGIQAARADLFEGAVCILTPNEKTQPVAALRIMRFWEMLGCRVASMDPGRHDEVVAAISHLPHLLAAALVDLVAEREPAAFDFLGPGFRDTTRVAGGPSAMWAEILRTNRGPVKKSLEAMIEKLEEIAILLDQTDGAPIQDFLERTRNQRSALRQNP